MRHARPPFRRWDKRREFVGSRNVRPMVRKAALPTKMFLAQMSAGFPLAYALFVASGIVFILFNLASLVASTEPIYASWLEVSQPFTDAVARIVPAVDTATAFLQQHRDFLEERDRLYWIPAIRNVLSIDFALILVLPLCYGIVLCIDLLRDRDRALANINKLDAASRERGYSIGDVLWRLVLFLSIFFLPVYFGLVGTVQPSLISFGRNMNYYFIVLGVDGLVLFQTIYYVMSFAVLKMGPRPEHLGNAAPNKPSET